MVSCVSTVLCALKVMFHWKNKLLDYISLTILAFGNLKPNSVEEHLKAFFFLKDAILILHQPFTDEMTEIFNL